MSSSAVAMTDDERMQGIAIYALYIVAAFTGVPYLIGGILAYLFRGNAASAVKSHFEHQIGLFWKVLILGIVGGILIGLGGALSATVILAIIGLPMMLVGGLMLLWAWIMTLIRSVKGLQLLNDRQPYPVPTGWGL